MKQTRRLLIAITITAGLALSIFSTAQAQDREETAAEAARQAPAPLIPTNQRACATNLVTNLNGVFQNSGLSASIHNGVETRNVIIQFSSETKVGNAPAAPGSNRLDVRYSINGAAPVVIGPEFFSVDRQNFATRTAIAVRTLGPGLWTIRPFFRTTIAGQQAQLFFRCLTLEARTE
jgi:hypothetical protein